MTTLLEYFGALSYSKTLTAFFHLNNQVAKRKLAVCNNNNLLLFCTVPTYFGVKLDKSLTFRCNIKTLCIKLKSYIALLRYKWGAEAKALQIADLSLTYSTFEYCTPIWY